MPGKVNPVMPETVNQLYYLISGYNITIYQATQGAHLQLGVMLPIIADTIISMLKLTTAVFKNFDEKCISVLKIDEENCRKNLENSTAYATLLTPVLGYDKVSQIVKEAIENKTSIRQIIIEKNILTEEEFNKIIT
jgi:aspartate ammonia-lyase